MRFQEEEAVILKPEFLLNPDSEAQARQRPPLNLPSAGRAFCKPKGFSSEALIEEAGLKGERTGGAGASAPHVNFIINKRGATSKKEEIERRSDSQPKLEVRCVPYELEGER